MSLDKILALVFSISGIAYTYWFFLMRKEKELMATSELVDIIVDGGYQPEVISIPVGKTTKLNFLRKDSSTCLEEVVLSDFKIKKYLPLNQKVSVVITPKNKGEYDFACGMNMFHGKLRVF